jgi:polygalacturonase
MKRVIVDYKKLTQEIVDLLVEKYPDGYKNKDIITFRNAKNEMIEAVQVDTEDTIFLVKVSQRLLDTIEDYDADEDYDQDEDDSSENEEPIEEMELD